MRSSREDTERHRREIVEASARLMREKGAESVSVPELMNAVGMTHGGFYKHFKSKDDLISAAYGKAFDEIVERLDAIPAAEGDPAAWDAMLDGYLSKAHRDNAGAGCPTAALAGDAARLDGSSPAQAVYEDGVRRMLSRLGAIRGNEATDPSNLAALSTMVGALLLARATTGELSDAFLKAARDQHGQRSADRPRP